MAARINAEQEFLGGSLYFPIAHNTLCLPPKLLHKLLFWEYAVFPGEFETIVNAKFLGQTTCIMGSWEIDKGRSDKGKLR